MRMPDSNTQAEFEEDVRLAEAALTAKRMDDLALEEAAICYDDPKYIALLNDGATGGEFYDAIHALFREILETEDSDPITVSSQLRDEVKKVALAYFRPKVEALHR